MLQLNLLYTAITRAKKLVVLVGSSRAIAIAARISFLKWVLGKKPDGGGVTGGRGFQLRF
jgi:hypothetical protein